MIRSYRELTTWKRAMELAEAIYRATADFPDAERYGLSSQMRRAAVSIVPNIADGRGRRATKDFRRFLDIAYGSLCELETQLLLSERLGLLSEKESRSPTQLAMETGRLLNGLRSSLVVRIKRREREARTK